MAVGAVFAPTRVLLSKNFHSRNSGVGGGGQNWILMHWVFQGIWGNLGGEFRVIPVAWATLETEPFKPRASYAFPERPNQMRRTSDINFSGQVPGWDTLAKGPLPTPTTWFRALFGRNRAIVIAESLARVIAAIRITSVRWQSDLPLKHRNLYS